MMLKIQSKKKIFFTFCGLFLIWVVLITIKNKPNKIMLFADDTLSKCGCRQFFSTYQSNLEMKSMCNFETDTFANQKVISYSFFGNIYNENDYLTWYSKGILENAELLPIYYGSEWRMRVYHDGDIDEDFLCKAYCKYPYLDFCDINNIPHEVTLTEVEPTVWRFLPLMDPLVKIFHSRDLDSRPSDREIAAINEFHESEYMFHIMRDHKSHRAPILAGMWGAKPTKDLDFGKLLVQRILKNENELFEPKKSKTTDQTLLTKYLFFEIIPFTMSHDSYHCGIYKSASIRPFPIQRKEESYNFVGSQMYGNVEPVFDACPPPCRPKDHQDWLFC